MFKVFKTGGLVAASLNAGTGADNQGKTAMEADTKKHGRSSTSQKGRGNIFRIAYSTALAMILAIACNDEQQVTGVRLDQNSIRLVVGESVKLNATVIPEDAAEKTVYWFSENPDIATVDSDGTVTGVGLGTYSVSERTVRVFVRTKERNFEAYCNVTVIAPEIIITKQPVPITDLIVGYITGNVSVEASVTGNATLNYQWYISTTSSNLSGTSIAGATNAEFTIPTTLTAGTYYYFCEVSATSGATSVRSNVVRVDVMFSGIWTQKSNIPMENAMFGFSIENKGYIGSISDFWEYDPVSNSWSQKAKFESMLNSRVGFSIGNKGYTMGIIPDVINVNVGYYLTMEYDPVLNSWIQKAPFSGAAYGSVGFSIGNMGYAGTGFNYTSGSNNRSVLDDFFEYDPVSDVWTRKSNFAGGSRYGAVGFSIDNKGYVGIGIGNGNDFWEYDPISDSWSQKANVPGGSRDSAVGFSIGNKGYVGTGGGGEWVWETGTRRQDFWEYDPASNTWTQKANFAGGVRTRAVSFSIGNKGYVGAGSNGDGFQQDFWEFTP